MESVLEEIRLNTEQNGAVDESASTAEESNVDNKSAPSRINLPEGFCEAVGFL